jgi:hypothetical protein
MISAEALAHGHALSFADQPYLGEIFTTLKRKREHLTLVVGAGVSMNASLPSWSGLVWNMAEDIKDEKLKQMLRDPSTDTLERRAETAIHIACAANKNINPFEVIRDALYPQAKVPTPGLLSLSIGRLVALYFPNVSVLTTNFDLVLEEAFANYLKDIDIQPFSIDSYTEWQSSEADPKRLGVLHLHGVIRQQGLPPLRPVVLTDSDFLEHGVRVRSAVSSAIATGTTLFVGLSLTDPNIVGPLYESSKSKSPRSERYGLFVPRLHGGGYTADEHAGYALASAEFLKTKLELRPIFLKSYSQLNQLLSELGLAVREPDLYRRNAPKSASLHYGSRFREALAQAYSSVGANSRTGDMTAEKSYQLSRGLYDGLRSARGPLLLLNQYRRKYRGSIAARENFGLFLWLRSLDKPEEKKYALTLIGSSVYTHLESWGREREEMIVGDSNYAAVHAIFEGGVKLENRDAGSKWRGVVAVPLIVNGQRSSQRLGDDYLDSLVIGALTLDTTELVDAQGGVAAEDLSVLSQLTTDEFQKVVDSVYQVAGAIIR